METNKNPLDDARAALNMYDLAGTDVGRYHGMKRSAEALRALIAEHERLTAPPTDDDREALAKAAWREHSVGFGFETDEQEYGEMRAFLAGFAAGFRRQGPITDAQVEAAVQAHERFFDEYPGTEHDGMRAALEAARDVSG